jgi:hypothetical protein
MLKRRTILLLAAVMTLGAAFAVPSVSTDRGAEVCAIVWLAEQQCERQEVQVATRRNAVVAAAGVYIHSQAPRVHGFHWPASYQRPPTFSSLS